MTQERNQTPPNSTPPREIDLTEKGVRELVKAQSHFPEHLADLSLRHVADGWDNSTWRLGEELALRLPRRLASVHLIRNEQQWLPVLSELISCALPVPAFQGKPAGPYPWHWSVVPWLNGETAAVSPMSGGSAREFATLLRGLHTEAPEQAPHNPYRGVPLSRREQTFDDRLLELEDHRQVLEDHFLTPDLLRSSFEAGLESNWEHAPVWLHGDLHPKNILVQSGKIEAIIDWGDLCQGDPASDLASCWMLYPRRFHDQFWGAYFGGANRSSSSAQPQGDSTDRHRTELRQRSAAWAILFGVLFVLTGLADDDQFLQIGLHTLRRASTP